MLCLFLCFFAEDSFSINNGGDGGERNRPSLALDNIPRREWWGEGRKDGGGEEGKEKERERESRKESEKGKGEEQRCKPFFENRKRGGVGGCLFFSLFLVTEGRRRGVGTVDIFDSLSFCFTSDSKNDFSSLSHRLCSSSLFSQHHKKTTCEYSYS